MDEKIRASDKIHINPKYMNRNKDSVHVNPHHVNNSSACFAIGSYYNYNATQNPASVYYNQFGGLICNPQNQYYYNNASYQYGNGMAYYTPNVGNGMTNVRTPGNYINPNPCMTTQLVQPEYSQPSPPIQQNVLPVTQPNIVQNKGSQTYFNEINKSTKCYVNPKIYKNFKQTPNVVLEEQNLISQKMMAIVHKTLPQTSTISSNRSVKSCSADVKKSLFYKTPDLKNVLKSTTEKLNIVKNLRVKSEAQLVDLNNQKNNVIMKDKVLLCKSNSVIGIKSNKLATPVFQSKTKLVRSSRDSVALFKQSVHHMPVVTIKKHQSYSPVKMSIPILKTKNKIIRKNGTSQPRPVPTFSSKLSPKNRNNFNISSQISAKYKLISKNKLIRRSSISERNKLLKHKLSPKIKSSVMKKVNKYQQRTHCKKTDNFINIGGAMFKTTDTTLKRQIVQTKPVCMKNNQIKCSQRYNSFSSVWNKSFHTHKSAFPSLTSLKFTMSAASANRNKPVPDKHKYKLNNVKSSSAPHTFKYKLNNKNRLTVNKKYSDSKLALKVLTQQRIIAAAKQRSLLVLRSRTTNNRTTIRNRRCTLNKKLDNNSNSTSSVSYCRFYHRYGRCSRGEKCPYVHNKDRVAICTRFLRGRCRDSKCLFAHTIDKGRMPVCSHFLKDALCIRDQCPYLHVKPNKDASVCEDFLHGHCDKKEKCELQHVLECAEFRVLGRCPRINCPLPHKQNKTSVVKNKLKKNHQDGPVKKIVKRTLLNSAVLGEKELPRIKRLKLNNTTNKDDKVVEKQRYFDTTNKCINNTPGKIEDVSESTKHESKIHQEISIKRERIMKFVSKLKDRNASSTECFNISCKSVPSKQIYKEGKLELVDEKDTLFIQPLDEFASQLDSLPDFIPI